jgi:hypothetical protein
MNEMQLLARCSFWRLVEDLKRKKINPMFPSLELSCPFVFVAFWTLISIASSKDDRRMQNM